MRYAINLSFSLDAPYCFLLLTVFFYSDFVSCMYSKIFYASKMLFKKRFIGLVRLSKHSMAQLLLRASAIWQHLPGLSDNYRLGFHISSLSQSLPSPGTFKNIFLKFYLFLAVLSVLCCSSLVVDARRLIVVTSSCCRAPALEVWALVLRLWGL